MLDRQGLVDYLFYKVICVAKLTDRDFGVKRWELGVEEGCPCCLELCRVVIYLWQRVRYRQASYTWLDFTASVCDQKYVHVNSNDLVVLGRLVFFF